MAQNTGDVDRTARVLAGAVLGIPVLARGLVGTIGAVAGAVSVYLLLSAVMGWDPFYAVLRFSTRSPNDVNPPPPR